MKRPPIIVIMGSVDHGKTTLLDYIRKTNVAAKEAGGITQAVGAYEITHQAQTYAERTQTNAEKIPRQSASSPRASASSEERRITFIDTPGHEAFSKMKARGAKIADIAILVVAADDSVQPQTKAAIKIIQDAKIPMIVAINKIDKPGVDPNRVKNDLTQAGVLLEGYGGNISNQEISAKTGKGVNELLDLILLTAEVENLEFNPANQTRGFVLESKLDKRKGIIATVIIKDGALRQNDEISAGPASGKVKILENFLGKTVKELMPSAPARIFGFETLPKAGDEFLAGKEIHPAAAPQTNLAAKKPASVAVTEKKNENVVNIILKADVSGSLEALTEILKNLPLKKDQSIKIVDESVGDITDGDVQLAISTKALVIGFKTETHKAAETLARANNIKIVESEIIYDLVKTIEETLMSIGKRVAKGQLEILATFGKKSGNQIIGGKVTEGVISNNAILEIERKGEVIGTGKIINLQQNKKDVRSAAAENECGLLFDSQVEIKVGDILIAH